jgi:uncharacterized protein YcbK (DUF882 family)
MPPPVLFTLALLLFGPPAYAGQGGGAQTREVSASEFIEQLPAMLEAVPAPPDVTEAELVELEENDPETYTFVNAARAHPPRPVNLGGDGRLALSRPASGERVFARYRNKDGTYNAEELEKINKLMRCRLTGKEAPISVKLVEILDAIEDKFGKEGLTVLSGYRTPTLNHWLPGAASRSLHMLGWAADIRVPGHGPAEVAAYARKLRAGGVGYYPDASFAHLDSGRPRHWTVRRPGAPRPAAAPAK